MKLFSNLTIIFMVVAFVIMLVEPETINSQTMLLWVAITFKSLAGIFKE